MIENLTRESFLPHLNTAFQIGPGSGVLTLELIEVSELRGSRHNEVFSLVFRGPTTTFVPQAMYRFTHPALDELALFIVPIGRDEEGLYYEAVFNRLRRKE
jgi:hypothetical protein